MTSPAALCRARSWPPGTLLAGPDGAVLVTAVGEAAVLAKPTEEQA